MKVNEIFTSIDGEVNKWGQGVFSTFVRLAGCNLNCSYCDTKYARKKEAGKECNILEVLSEVQKSKVKKVTITGGEPLLQYDEVCTVIKFLLNGDYKVSLETNGSFIPPLITNPNTWRNFSLIVDYKLEYENEMVFDPELLRKNDFIKIVVGSIEDYQKARDFIKSADTEARIFISPMFGKVAPSDIIKELKKDELFHVGLNLQIHKIIWPDGKEV